MGLGTAPPFFPDDVREGLRLQSANYSSTEIQKLNTECMQLVIDLRVKQKEYDKTIKQHLQELNGFISRVESERGDLVRWSTELLGYEKIAKKRAKDYKDAEKKSDAKKKDAVEKQIRKEAEGYDKALKKASAAAARIELNLEKIDKLLKKLREAGSTIPEAQQSRFKLPALKTAL